MCMIAASARAVHIAGLARSTCSSGFGGIAEKPMCHARVAPGGGCSGFDSPPLQARKAAANNRKGLFIMYGDAPIPAEGTRHYGVRALNVSLLLDSASVQL